MRLCLVLVLAVMACGPKSKPRQTTPAGEQCFYDCKDSKTGAGDAPNPSGVSSEPANAPAKPAGKLTPAGEKAALLRQAADLLEKAGDQLASGNKNLAENFFSTAELLVGPEALASLAPQFREGAPPRVTTPTKKFDTNVAAQARAVGSSDEEDEEDEDEDVKGCIASGYLMRLT